MDHPQLGFDNSVSPSPAFDSDQSEFVPSPPKRPRVTGEGPRLLRPPGSGPSSGAGPVAVGQGGKPKRRRNRKHNSCEPCRIRKVKCDRQANCANCRLHGQICHYVDAVPISLGPEDELAKARDEIARLRVLVGVLAKQLGVSSTVETMLNPGAGGLDDLIAASEKLKREGSSHEDAIAATANAAITSSPELRLPPLPLSRQPSITGGHRKTESTSSAGTALTVPTTGDDHSGSRRGSNASQASSITSVTPGSGHLSHYPSPRHSPGSSLLANLSLSTPPSSFQPLQWGLPHHSPPVPSNLAPPTEQPRPSILRPTPVYPPAQPIASSSGGGVDSITPSRTVAPGGGFGASGSTQSVRTVGLGMDFNFGGVGGGANAAPGADAVTGFWNGVFGPGGFGGAQL